MGHDAYAPAALAAATEALYVTALDGTILYWTPSAAQLFGYEAAQAQGQNATVLLSPARSALAADAAIQEAVATAYAFAELTRQRQDGGLLETRVAIRRIASTEAGEDVLAVAERDLGPMQRLEAVLLDELHAAQNHGALLRTVLDGATELAMIATDRDARIQVWSSGAEQVFGRSTREMLQRNWLLMLQALLPGNEERLHQAFHQALQAQSFRGEFDARDAQGRRFPVSLLVCPRPNHFDDIVGVVIVAQSLSSQRRAIEMEVQRDAALASERLQAEFLAHMSHEIRTPMNSVVAISRLLEGTELTAAQREMLNILRLGSDHLLALINDILDFSRLRAGKVDLEHKPFNLRLCIEESLEMVAPRATEKALSLSYTLAPDVPAQVLGDAARLRQVLLNLLSNAVKFTHQGSVHVDVTGQRQHGQHWEYQFVVQDTGIGIEPQRMHRLFDEFSQIDASTSREYGGTGLGLAICKRLCTLMGGSISASSTPGEGSRFCFTWLAEAESEAAAALAPDDALRSLRVLVVDDSASDAEVLSRQLQSLGAQAVCANSAESALRLLLSGEAFDLAILDQRMPGMTGAELSACIRRQLPAKALPQILLSAYPVHAEDIQALDPAIEAVLPKPLRGPVLKRYLHDILQRRQTPAVNTSVPLRPLRLLLADDSEMIRRVGLMMLERLGCQADLAENGVQVLRAVEQVPYDLILMDVQMPELDGIDTTRAIRARGNAIHQPQIVAMTARAMTGDRERCLNAGMDGYLSKPIDPEALARLLRSLSQRLARAESLQAGSVPPVATPDTPADAPAPAPADDEIDPAMLAQIAATLGEHAVPDVIDLFMQESPRRLRLLVDGARSPEGLFELTRQAHTLKSNAGTIGAHRMARLCAELEKMGRGQQSEALDAHVAALQQVHQRVCVELLALRARYAGESCGRGGS